MKIHSPKLFVEMSNSDFIFAVGDEIDQGNFKLIYKLSKPMTGIEKYQITDFDLVLNTIKNNIYTIEQELNYTFKEIILIIDNFNSSFISLTGFKKLNGSKILKENITYILNSLKSNIDELEKRSTILHIFNSKYFLDKKKIENLPIGLFGEFYSHELSFCLINKNDYKNLQNIFDKCNLKIKKILLKGFVEGSLISNDNENPDTFFQIKINKNDSEILYFENDSLKFQEKFNFGSELVTRDISKVTSLKLNNVKKIIDNINFNGTISEDELVEKKFFEDENYRKIRQGLLLEVAKARIEEIIEKLIIKNINFKSFKKNNKRIFLKISDENHLKCFKDIYIQFFSKNNKFEVKFINDISTEEVIKNVNNLVLFGWKKEAIPVSLEKKSIVARFFEAIFGQ
jgi:cell division protein FtsA